MTTTVNSTDLVLINEHNYFAELILNLPEQRNALSPKLINAIIAAATHLAAKSHLRFILLKAQGTSFCAGADLNWMKVQKSASSVANFVDSKCLSNLFATLYHLHIPLIGLVQGHVYGGGVGLVSVCDYVLADPAAQFCLSEVKLGLIPAVISPYVQQKIGTSWFQALGISAKVFKTDFAQKIGLIHDVVSLDQMDLRVQELFMNNAPMAMREHKKLVRQQFSLAPGSSVNDVDIFTRSTIALLRKSPEGQEGMSALLEKRTADWTKI